MRKQHEQLLVAALAGLVIVGAAAFVVQPAMAAGYQVEQQAQVTGVAKWDRLNIRKWPASYSQKTGSLKPHTYVWVERCIEASQGSDWCLVERGNQMGWVNSAYLTLAGDLDI
ncbi:SH3 domain-containing protein [Paradevosia shaoguanensis]|uniref:SH3b domain-containing protein n=1 Tax=Paradevosia shaoguanensis TaxID=1335043 RepID=A0AA41QLU1_9HYPH|nr:SH3 domain-containing protein [Paradevosia shaoguanensis]MCF1741706.1 hypothetical protein [Paradevosia shaoguanensis]MCI0126189.1 hypothetical protein [Paradevosia shaoguanensis]QMV02955.1 hypothetical protein GHV40_16350 [Devosia sp. D6-9]